MIEWWELSALASLVGLCMLIPLWGYKAEQRRNDALEEMFSGFAHGINAALKAGFRVETFEGGNFPQCRLGCSSNKADPPLTLYVRLSGGRRGSIFTDAYDIAARQHFRAKLFERQYTMLSSNLGTKFYEDIDAKFFADIIAQDQEWIKSKNATEPFPHREDEPGVARTSG